MWDGKEDECLLALQLNSPIPRPPCSVIISGASAGPHKRYARRAPLISTKSTIFFLSDETGVMSVCRAREDYLGSDATCERLQIEGWDKADVPTYVPTYPTCLNVITLMQSSQ